MPKSIVVIIIKDYLYKYYDTYFVLFKYSVYSLIEEIKLTILKVIVLHVVWPWETLSTCISLQHARSVRRVEREGNDSTNQ